MKIFLTGANGMVGKNILEHANAKNHQFLIPRSSELNLLNFKEVEGYIKSNSPDIVIHCAGKVGGIQANIKEPVEFLIQNLEMGKNVLLASRNPSVKKVINMASSCMYPKNFDGYLKEEMILTGPLEPTNEGYALAKIAVMKLGQYLNKEDGKLKYKTLVPCNLFGRWDKFSPEHSHMIPAVIRKIFEAKKNNINSVEVWGSGSAKREFMCSSDLADFTFFALDNWDKIPEVINVGLGFDYTINEYYQAIAKALDYHGEFHHDLTKPEGMKRKVVNVENLNELGWKAKKSLPDGIKEAFQFFVEKEHV